MSPFPAALITTIYHSCKDMLLFVNRRRQDIRDLEERISKLIVHLNAIQSVKERIDNFLRKRVSIGESAEYAVAKAEIGVINRKYIKFVDKYARLTTNQLSSSTELNASTASLMIGRLADLNSKIATFHFLKLAKLSRDIAKLTRQADRVLNSLGRLDRMIQPNSEPILDELNDGGDNVLPVFNTYVLQILEYLRENGNGLVGISGSKGVGKTTVLKKLYNRLIKQNSLSDDGNREYHLDCIIFIEYPPETETKMNEDDIVKKLQDEIMEQLEIHHESSSNIVVNANTISAFLCEKHYILLMDNVSSSVDLDKVGLRSWHKHKKVVICSRERNVIRNMTEYVVEIQRLEKHEGWILFASIYGELYDPTKRRVADRIVEYCAGIPGMIRGVAKHLKNKKDDKSWHSVKDILQSKSKSLEFLELGGFDKVYEVKYQGLETNTKKCLLYGTLFPHLHEIYVDNLIECWIAEGFMVEDANQKVRFNRDLGQTILDHLTDQDFLEWCSGKKYVRMTPEFRRVALELDYPDENECVCWVPCEGRHPGPNTWAKVTRMSLIGCTLELPISPECPNIGTLLLQALRSNPAELHATFFCHMGTLQILNLNNTGIEALPTSIENLVNLKSLYLNGCNDLASLPREATGLKKLEFLDICGTSISTLPQGISCMVDMRCLRASVKEFEFELIYLENLEELCIDTSFQNRIDTAESLAAELATLKYLTTLCFNFPNVSSLNTFVSQSMALQNIHTNWEADTLRSFKIFIGSHETERRDHEPDFSGILAERWLRYSTNEIFSTACQQLLDQASAFEVIGHDDLKTCSHFDLQSVKVCAVEHCKSVENFVNGDISQEQSFSDGSLLRNLEKLYLYKLEKLKCIWEGPVRPGALTSLTAITIHGCPLLKEVLDHKLARWLRSLKYLKVDDCCHVSKIIESSASDDLLESLKTMELSNLPELESICESSTSISWKSLKSIIVVRCSTLRNLCLTLENARKLASIQCEESWWMTLAFPDELRQRLLPICFYMAEHSQENPLDRAGENHDQVE